jgi:spore maturation protein CgeB
MIIHLIGAQKSNYPWGFENRLIPAINELGHTLISTDFRQERNRLPERLALPADLILVCKGEGLDPHLIESSPCATVLWYAEQVGNDRAYDETALARRQELSFNIAAFDYVFSHDPSNLPVYRQLGAEHCAALPCAAVDPALNRRLDVAKRHDVVFVGSKTSRRLALLEAIGRTGITVFSPEIWSGEEMNRLFNESRIVLNLHLSDLANTETRIAEVLGAGSFLLSETLSDPDLVREGEHYGALPTGDMEGLAHRVRYYLDHEEEREAIAARGHDHIHRHHTYGQRIQQILDTVDFAINRRIWPAYTLGVPVNRHGKPTLRLDRFNAQVAGLLAGDDHPLPAVPPFAVEKYRNDGWGISRLGFIRLFELIARNPKTTIRILEFGSGISTTFFSDLATILAKEITVTSFDNDTEYMYTDTSRINVRVHLRELEETDDASFVGMFQERRYRREFMYPKTSPVTTRQRNNFYRLHPGDLEGVYDYMLLDGPNGNGRSLAFLHARPHLTKHSVVFIDDYTHYDFVDKFLMVFEGEELYKHTGGSIDRWNSGGDFTIFRVRS